MPQQREILSITLYLHGTAIRYNICMHLLYDIFHKFVSGLYLNFHKQSSLIQKAIIHCFAIQTPGKQLSHY